MLALPLNRHAAEHDASTDRTRDTRGGPLVGGAARFGIGWGVSGICPGPSLVLLGQDPFEIYTFLASMILGGFVADKISASGTPAPAQPMSMKA